MEVRVEVRVEVRREGGRQGGSEGGSEPGSEQGRKRRREGEDEGTVKTRRRPHVRIWRHCTHCTTHHMHTNMHSHIYISYTYTYTLPPPRLLPIPIAPSYYRPFKTLQDSTNMTGNCKDAGAGYGHNEMYPCFNEVSSLILPPTPSPPPLPPGTILCPASYIHRHLPATPSCVGGHAPLLEV
jgi:hypothetical protein